MDSPWTGTLSMDSPWTASGSLGPRVDAGPPGAVWELRREADPTRLDGLAPKSHDLRADAVRCLGVALAVPRQVVERHRLPPDDRAQAPVQHRPAERVEPQRDNGNAFLHRDHQPARVQRPRMAEALARPLDVHADETALTHDLP